MILVTGGTGLVGSHVLFQLVNANEKVRAIHRKDSDLNAVKRVFSYYSDQADDLFDSIEWLIADITDVVSLEKAFENVTQVYHCAALVSFDKRDYAAMRLINIEGTANMVNFALVNKVEKFCFVSSIATLEKNGKEVINENNEWNNETNNYGYAITKYGAEIEVWRASQEGLNVVIVNPGVILGAGFWHKGTGELFTKAYHEFKFYTNGSTGFVAVTDVAKAMIQLMQSEVVNERFVLVSENKTFKELFFAIAEYFNKKKPSIEVGSVLSGIAWRLEWLKSTLTGKSPLITKHSAKASLSNYAYSSQKIKDTIGFEFEPFNETISRVSNYYKKDIV